MPPKTRHQISLERDTQSEECRPHTSQMSCRLDEGELASTSELDTNVRHLSGQTHPPGNLSHGMTETTRALRKIQKPGRSRSPPLTKTYRDVAIGSKSMNLTALDMNFHQLNSASGTDSLDVDIVLQVSPFPGKPPHDMADEHYGTATSLNSDVTSKSHARKASRQTRIQSDRRRPDVPVKGPVGGFKHIFSFFSSNNGLPSGNSNLEQQLSERDREIVHLQTALDNADGIIQGIQKDHQKDIKNQEQEFQKALYDQQRQFEARENDIKNREQEFQKALHDQQRQFEARENDIIQSVPRLQAQIQRLESDRTAIQQKYDTVIRIQQERSFEQMESGRWLPSEESKVVDNLDRIKREMRGWAKAISIKKMPLFQTLEKVDATALMKDLSYVVLIENNQLPQGLTTPKSPSLLLNALLSHDIYTTIIRNPFFFLNDGLGNDLPRAGVEDTLHEIYRLAQDSNQQDAHIWRSQLLRLLLPPLRSDSRNGEKFLHSSTEAMIAKISERQASKFLAGSARHFINNDAKIDYTKKIKAIYQEAATLSYRLWTRRTAMRCSTLHEIKHIKFDAESSYLVPHSLVRYDNHKDLLAGRQITVIVHPLLEVYGTDEARDYDKGRVWAPAEVWLDSK